MGKLSWKDRWHEFYRHLKGDTIEYDVASYQPLVQAIKQHAANAQRCTDHELQQMSQTLRTRARQGETLDDLLSETYALVRETVQRVLHLQPFDVQLIGGIVLHQGKLAEMQTGEGKTLTAVFPAYLNALTGQGVHILTFNDYLARRDAHWMGSIYQFLGLTVGVVQEGMARTERQQAYQADITYLTAKEAGFDFLRDSLCMSPDERVQRPFHFAIVDEADSILIDEARVPLIIAGAVDDAIPDSTRFAAVAHTLEEGVDVACDEGRRNVYLTDAGIDRVQTLLPCANIYAADQVEVFNRLQCALHAEFLLQRDVDYIVRNGKIELVDEFTGRVADQRRWPDGIQAALEAKEQLSRQRRGRMLNSITLQHFIRRYPKLAGMTATAVSAGEEFQSIYNLPIVVIPPNTPCQRQDLNDVIFHTAAEQQTALLDEILRVHRTQRPILVGTHSVAESERLAHALRQQGVTCAVLNAKNDEHEACIIAEAGQLGAVTISTNMAGRGTDIRLGGADERDKTRVVALGGLYVLGTHRHESQRIDRQLRGRAGRQGDPGSSRFLINLEDELFVTYRLTRLLPPGLLESNAAVASHSLYPGEIDNPVLRREITRIQRIIEGQHGSIKKTLYQYSTLLETQRQALSAKREEILTTAAAVEFFAAQANEHFEAYQTRVGGEALERVSRQIWLGCIDAAWSQYLADMAEVRESIHFLRLGEQDPYFQFRKLAVTSFAEVLNDIETDALRIFTTLNVSANGLAHNDPRLKIPSATWTYLINDDPFERASGLGMIVKIGVSPDAAILALLYLLAQKFKKKRL